jgi:UDP-N-acetylglucosamine acyltransferase
MTNEIHPTAILGEGVRLGSGNRIGPFVVIEPGVVIGDDNWIGTGVVLGAEPEVRSHSHARGGAASAGAGLVMGSGNVIREYAQIHRGLKTTTRVGDSCFVMNQVYVAHDGLIGDGVTMASSVLLAGHVTVGDGANLGLGASVHQFRTVGAGAMVGMGSVVTRDIPPFALAFGSPATIRGANRVGLTRSGVEASVVDLLQDAYVSGAVVDLAGIELPEPIARAFAVESV